MQLVVTEYHPNTQFDVERKVENQLHKVSQGRHEVHKGRNVNGRRLANGSGEMLNAEFRKQFPGCVGLVNDSFRVKDHAIYMG
jgi:hypothetical protein